MFQSENKQFSLILKCRSSWRPSSSYCIAFDFSKIQVRTLNRTFLNSTAVGRLSGIVDVAAAAASRNLEAITVAVACNVIRILHTTVSQGSSELFSLVKTY